MGNVWLNAARPREKTTTTKRVVTHDAILGVTNRPHTLGRKARTDDAFPLAVRGPNAMAGARQHRAEEGACARPTKGGAMRTRIALVAVFAVATMIAVSSAVLIPPVSSQAASTATHRSSTPTSSIPSATQLVGFDSPNSSGSHRRQRLRPGSPALLGTRRSRRRQHRGGAGSGAALAPVVPRHRRRPPPWRPRPPRRWRHRPRAGRPGVGRQRHLDRPMPIGAEWPPARRADGSGTPAPSTRTRSGSMPPTGTPTAAVPMFPRRRRLPWPSGSRAPVMSPIRMGARPGNQFRPGMTGDPVSAAVTITVADGPVGTQPAGPSLLPEAIG